MLAGRRAIFAPENKSVLAESIGMPIKRDTALIRRITAAAYCTELESYRMLSYVQG